MRYFTWDTVPRAFDHEGHIGSLLLAADHPTDGLQAQDSASHPQLAPTLSCTLPLNKVVDLEMDLGVDKLGLLLKINNLLEKNSTHLGRLTVAKFQMPEEQVDDFIRRCTEILTTDSKQYISRFGYTIKAHFLGDTLRIIFCFPFLNNTLERMQKFDFLINSQNNNPPIMNFSLNHSPNKETRKGLKMTFNSQRAATAQFMEIKAGQGILHLFIVPSVLGVDLQNERVGHPEAVGIMEQDLRTIHHPRQ